MNSAGTRTPTSAWPTQEFSRSAGPWENGHPANRLHSYARSSHQTFPRIKSFDFGMALLDRGLMHVP